MRASFFDVIVIGAGPAGVSAVLELTQGGARVALIDRAEFPRQKACAGALSAGTLRLLKYDASPSFREQVNEIQMSLNYSQQVIARSERPFVAMTRRSEFDLLGFDLASSASGCEVFICRGSHTLSQDETGVTVEYPGLRLKASYVIAADGASSPTRRLLLKEINRKQAISIEADVDINDVRARGKCATRVDFGVVKGGGGWVFPKGDHCNVGLYTYDKRFSLGIHRRELRDYALSVLGTEQLSEVRGFPIGIDCTGSRMSRGRVFFVGDAGGFSYTHSGEGIYGAVLTGQLCATAILADKEVAQVYRASAARYLRRCAINRGLCQPVYGVLGLSYRLLASRISSQIAGEGGRSIDSGLS